MEKKIDYKKQGKRNKAAGARFEKRTREDLESKGWIVSKWQNNVELPEYEKAEIIYVDGHKEKHPCRENKEGKCIPAKQGRFMTNQGGFPDFIAYKIYYADECFWTDDSKCAEVIFIECKVNGYLKPEEKEKARWYLDNNYCSKFCIAKKVKEGRKVKVEYIDFEEKYG